MSDARQNASDVDVDLGQLFGSLARNWLRILIAALVVTGLAFVLASMVTPLYRAETRILIEARESIYTRPASSGLGEGAAALPDAETIASQVEIIGSSDNLREVARRLDLASRDGFGAAGETSMLGNLMILAGLKSDPTLAPVEERVLEALQERLRIFQVDGSRVIVVRFAADDPELAASVANAIADVYIAAQEQAKRMADADASEWLEPEIESLRGRVREAEERVAAYRGQAGLLVGQNNLALPTQELAELSSELTRARADRSAAEARAAAIREAMAGNGSIETMPAVLASPMVQRLRESQARIEAELADLSASLLENHPRMRALRAQGEETARQLRAETARVLAATENEAATARGRESRLVAEVNRLKAASAQAGDDEVELRALEREAMAQRALLESYLTRHREAAARADRSPAPADARIFARAAAPSEAYFPRMMPILAAAFAGSLVVIAVLVLMRELFSGRAMRPAPGAFVERPAEDPQLWPQQPQDGIEPVLAVVAAEQEDESEEIERFAEEIAAGGEEDDEEDDVTMARNQPVKTTPGPEEITVAGIAGELVGSDVGRVVFISPEGDEATAVSVTVARTVADAGLRTLFLYLTWSGAPSAAMLEEEGRAGITDLLALRAKFADIIHGDVYSGCHVVPAGTVDPVEAMRAAERLPEILEALDDAYEVVIIECGAADAQTIAEVTSEDAEVLIGALDPRAKAVAGVAADLALLGYGEVLTVTPGARPARPGRRGRLAA
jgi:uncharacterized protein involved in exopolysaccharide biosynthesis/Mrp family chromosome partitioning ATPase